MKVDWLIIGAGFTGSVLAERIASKLNQKVLVVDKRDHIAGNAYDQYDSNGVLVHQYGAHIFHTNSDKVWQYLSQFTEWRPYQHRVLAMVDGQKVPVPFNLNTLRSLFPDGMADRLERLLVERYGFGVRVPILRMLDEPDSDLKFLSKFIYDRVFVGYTEKQWGMPVEKLDPSVTGRVPVLISRDDRYFQDIYQSIPSHGYTKLFSSLLSHPNIQILLKTDHRQAIDGVSFKRLIFTGPVDEYFDYLHGNLPYRSIRFQFQHFPESFLLDAAVVNYPNEYAFTRMVEFKRLTGQVCEGTTVATEFPESHVRGVNDPYYPIPTEETREQHALYLREAQRLTNSVIFAGRLADYRYYNMDQAVARALKVFTDHVVPVSQSIFDPSLLAPSAVV